MAEIETTIHIEWDGPTPLAQVKKKFNSYKTDFGVYQIYGGHPVYGNRALLYIGLAAEQPFGKRIAQEEQWLWNRDAGRVEVYVGRLIGKIPTPKEWGRLIRLAERLLIFAHMPPMNTQKNLLSLEGELRSVHVLNWGNHRDLLPEVSGKRWSSRYDKLSNQPFTMKETGHQRGARLPR